MFSITLAAWQSAAQPPAGEPPPLPPPEQPPQPDADARLKALEERIRVLEEQARVADARAVQSQRQLDALRAERDAELEAKKRAAAERPKEQKPEEEAPETPIATFDGYVEANYSYNFNRPENGITNFRGFDNRHDSFTLSNAVLGATFDHESLIGNLTLQIGHTPTTYYLAEPVSPGAAGVGGTDAATWKYIQQAYAGWEAPAGNGLQLVAGIFLSPIGFEGIAVKDNWNWSRSNLFFGLPFYHTGVKAMYEVNDQAKGMLMVSNGWNSVVDNNYWKSIATHWIIKPVPDVLTLSLLYFGGPERARGAPEGVPGVEPWRHLFDAWMQIDATDWLAFALHGDTGFEKNAFGTSWWAAGAVYARVQPIDWLYLAARGDVFGEHAAEDELGNTASHIFWPADLVGSGTFTVDFRPHSHFSFRVEYRHDEADGDMFFQDTVDGDGVTTPYVPNARRQDTLTFGATGWFR